MQCYVVVLDKPLIHCWYLYCMAAVMVESREDEDSDEGQEVATTLKRRELENRRDER